MTVTQERTSIHPATQIGFVSLTVSNVEHVLPFYTDLVGFTLLQRDGGTVVLGTQGTPLLSLVEDREAALWTESYTGLHHVAVLLPSRADLGRLYRHLLDRGYEPIGEEHRASEAIYFDDPDGHRMEVYQDRPRDTWDSMGGGDFDADGLLATASAEEGSWLGLPTGTRIGHMHIRVGDIERAKAFYGGILGFDVMAEMPDALFISAGGYHHHIGMNTWMSKGGGAPPEHMTGLRYFTVVLPDADALDEVVARLEGAGLPVERTPDGIVVPDPWETKLVFRVGAGLAVEDARALSLEA